MSDKPDEILTIVGVAAYLKPGKRTVYCLMANGELDKRPASRVRKAMTDDDERGAE
jgi:hypothetical protein